jgi:chorismate synthase
MQLLTSFIIGRVAAGAIAEKYLKLAYGIEIVAFVSSVGNIHLPANVAPPSLTPLNNDKNDDIAGDVLSKDFMALLTNITRDEVDKHPTKCPHPETAEKMTKVKLEFYSIRRIYFIFYLS